MVAVHGWSGCGAQLCERPAGRATVSRALDAVRLPWVHAERDAVDRAGRAAALLGHEVRLQVAHAEQRLRHVASLRGSRASRSPSPTPLSARTTSAMASPGNPDVQGAVAMYGWPS